MDDTNERMRTVNAYNLRQFDPLAATELWQLPILKAAHTVPKRLINFNDCISKKPDKDTGVHFYIDDYRFERIWNQPEKYIAKLKEWGCVFTPDFSLYMEMPFPMQLWNVFRSRLIGQMMQNDGIEVIPTLQWAGEDSFEYCFDGIEPGGIVSVSTVGVARNKEAMARWKAGMDRAMEVVQPECVLLYGKDIGYDFSCHVVNYKVDSIERMFERIRRK